MLVLLFERLHTEEDNCLSILTSETNKLPLLIQPTACSAKANKHHEWWGVDDELNDNNNSNNKVDDSQGLCNPFFAERGEVSDLPEGDCPDQSVLLGVGAPHHVQ